MKNNFRFNKTCFNLCFILSILSEGVVAQPISYYTFSSSNIAYEPLQGSIELGNSLNAGISFNNVPLGFSFVYGGLTSQEITVHSGGYIKFDGPITYPFDNYSPLTDVTTDDYIISPLGGVLSSDNETGKLSYTTNGTSPNRVFILEWNDYESSFTDHNYNFQLKLHETSNLIEFHYGNFEFVPEGFAAFLQVGLRGARSITPQDINQRSISQDINDWNTSTVSPFNEDAYAMLYTGLLPDDGLLYSWNPPANCSGTPVAGNAVASAQVLCLGQEITLNLEGIPTYTLGTTYTWEFSTNGIDYAQFESNSSSSFDTTFFSNGYFRSVVACNGITSTSNSILVESPAANTYAPIPFLETFEADWEDRCGTDVPNSDNWSSNGTFGEMSWKNGLPSDFSLPAFSGKAAIFENLFGNGSPLPDLSVGDLDVYLNLSGTENLSLSFDHINPFAFNTKDSLVIYLSTDVGATFIRKAKFKSNAGMPTDAQWNKKFVPLGVVNSTTCIVRFRAFSDASYISMAIDSVEIKNCNPFNIELTASTDTICRGTNATISASGADSYVWNNGENTNSITVFPFSTELYSILGITNNCSATNEIIIGVEDCTNLDNFENTGSAVLAMPNPTEGEINLSFKDVGQRSIYLMDVTGKSLLVIQSNAQNETLDLGKFSKGFYFIKVETKNNNAEVLKVIKN